MSDLIDREEVIKALRLEYPMMPLFKSLREEWAIKTEGYRKAEEVIMRLPSARPNNRGICGVCAGRKVCSENNRNLDMLECNMFELDEHYKISRPKGEWIDTKGGWKCTACDKWASFASDFCPNCGADMREREGE